MQICPLVSTFGAHSPALCLVAVCMDCPPTLPWELHLILLLLLLPSISRVQHTFNRNSEKRLLC